MVIIRRAEAGDNDQLLRLDSVAPPPGSVPQARTDFFHRGSLYGCSNYWVAECAGRIVACQAGGIKPVRFGREFLPAGHLFFARVHPDYRRRGISSALKDVAEAWCKDNGAVCSYAFVIAGNYPNQRLLEQRGYVVHATVSFYRCSEFLPAVASRVAEVILVKDLVTEMLPIYRACEEFYELYDGIPGDWRERIYANPCRRYRGSVVASDSGGAAWASMWDPEPGCCHTAGTLFDIGWTQDNGRDLVLAVVEYLSRARWMPFSIVIDSDDKHLEDVLRTFSAPCGSELFMVKWLQRPRSVRRPIYFDVRD